MTLGVRGLYQVDQTVFVGVRVEQTLILSWPQPVARGVARDCARTVLLTLLPCVKNMRLNQ